MDRDKERLLDLMAEAGLDAKALKADIDLLPPENIRYLIGHYERSGPVW